MRTRASHPAAAAPQAPPVVFVVDDDVSVRESLELLIRSGGWQPETFELVNISARLGLADLREG